MDGLTKTGKTTVMKCILPTLIVADPPRTDEPVYFKYFDLSLLLKAVNEPAKCWDKLLDEISAFSLSIGHHIDRQMYKSLDSFLRRLSVIAKTNHFHVILLWDEIQYLVKLDPEGDMKSFVSNPDHVNIWSVITGSGMAMAWGAFHTRFSTAGHSILTAGHTIHFPFSCEDAVIEKTSRLVQDYIVGHASSNAAMDLPDMMRTYAIERSPHNPAGIGYTLSTFLLRGVTDRQSAAPVLREILDKFVYEYIQGVAPLLEADGVTDQQRKEIWLLLAGLWEKPTRLVGWQSSHLAHHCRSFDNTSDTAEKQQREERWKELHLKDDGGPLPDTTWGVQGPSSLHTLVLHHILPTGKRKVRSLEELYTVTNDGIDFHNNADTALQLCRVASLSKLQVPDKDFPFWVQTYARSPI